MTRAILISLALGALVGCSTEKQMTFTTRPLPATIKIDGNDGGTSPLTTTLTFGNGVNTHRISASHTGYQPATVDVDATSASPVVIELKPVVRKVTINVLPFPAKITVNNRALNPAPVSSVSAELEFPQDAHGNWASYRVAAQRDGFQPAERTISGGDASTNYTITLEPMRKDVTLTTTPAGAKVYLDDEEIGTSPLTQKNIAFSIDPQTNQWNEYKLRAVKPGYDPVELRLSWDEGKSDYAIDFKPKTKTVRIISNPPNATVSIDGVEMPRDAQGASAQTLIFPPVDEKGELKTYTALVTKKTADSEWEPQRVVIAWDGGKSDYPVTLKEIKTMPVAMLRADPTRTDEGWTIVARRTTTLAMKDVNEGVGRQPPKKLTSLPKGTMIDSLALSPDGSHIIFPVLNSKGDNDLRSQLMMIKSDGSGGIENFSDGKSLDLQPSFRPDGLEIIYSSNRGGKRQSVWSQSAKGNPGITRLTNGDTTDLYPSIDPNSRLFYQAMIDTRPDPRIFMTELGKTTQTDITQAGGMQPRISPDATTLLYVSTNEKTGKRDIYKMPLKEGIAVNLTNSADVSDQFDPAWSPDGSKIAFVSDRGVDEDKRNNYDIWIMDVDHPDRRTQVTTNGSWDDCPVWDVDGSGIFFRSNRGGEWAIWRIRVK